MTTAAALNAFFAELSSDLPLELRGDLVVLAAKTALEYGFEVKVPAAAD